MTSIVIAGGGAVGHKLAHALQNEAHVTLIDPKPFFEIPMAVPRLMVKPRALPALLPYAEFLPKVARVEARLTSVESRQVTVTAQDASTATLPYDYLVLATGANYRSDLVKPLGYTSVEQRFAHFEGLARRIDAARRIMVVGGGAVGIETVGEIVERWPDKQVVLVHSGSDILARTTAKARRWAREFLESRGVRFVVGERLKVSAPPDDIDTTPGSLRTDKGTLVEYDLALWCTGTQPDAGYMRSHFADKLNERGEIQVEPTLRVVGMRNVFALGDVANFAEKGASWARFESDVALANLRSILKHGPDAPLKAYKRTMPSTMMLVTLGSRHGICALPFGTFRWSWMARSMKAATMFVPSYRKGVGLAPSPPFTGT